MKSVIMSLTVAIFGFATSANACNVVPQGTCYVKETQKYMAADQFFSAVSDLSNRTDACAVGRVAGKESGRFYWNGQRVAKERGCLSHREIKEIKGDIGILALTCETYTCEEQ